MLSSLYGTVEGRKIVNDELSEILEYSIRKAKVGTSNYRSNDGDEIKIKYS